MQIMCTSILLTEKTEILKPSNYLRNNFTVHNVRCYCHTMRLFLRNGLPSLTVTAYIFLLY